MKKLNFCDVFQIIYLIVLIAVTVKGNRENGLESRANLQAKEPRKVGNSRRIAYCDDQATAIAEDEERDSQWDSLRGSIPTSQFRCPYKSGRYGRRGNCRSYYQCTDDKACLGLCSPSESFDVRSGQCVPEAAGGGGGSTCYQEEAFNCPKKSGVFRHDRRCDRFFKCRYGQSYVVYCRQGEKFDVEVQRCVPEAAAICDEEGEIKVLEEIVNFSANVSVNCRAETAANASAILVPEVVANCSCL